MLCSTKYSVAEIAVQVDYDTEPAFNRAFNASSEIRRRGIGRWRGASRHKSMVRVGWRARRDSNTRPSA